MVSMFEVVPDDDYHLYKSSSPGSRDYLMVVALILFGLSGHKNRARHLTTLKGLRSDISGE